MASSGDASLLESRAPTVKSFMCFIDFTLERRIQIRTVARENHNPASHTVFLNMAQSSCRRTRQRVRDEVDTLPLLGQTNGTQSMREITAISRNGSRQEKATSEYWSPKAPSADKINRPRARSGRSSRISPK